MNSIKINSLLIGLLCLFRLQLSLNRTQANSDSRRISDPHQQFLRQQSVPGETSLVGRGDFLSPAAEDKIDSGDLDLRPTD